MSKIDELFSGGRIIDQSGKIVDIATHCAGKEIVCLYFGAHWSPPSRAFTPRLVEFYKKFSSENGFEVIFISADRDEESFDDFYHGEMSWWLALDFSSSDVKLRLQNIYAVRAMPSLIVLDGNTGETITKNGIKKLDEYDGSRISKDFWED